LTFSQCKERFDTFFFAKFLTHTLVELISAPKEVPWGFSYNHSSPSSFPLHLLCFFWVFPMYHLCCRKESHKGSFGVEKNLVGFFYTKFFFFSKHFFFSSSLCVMFIPKRHVELPLAPRKTHQVSFGNFLIFLPPFFFPPNH